MLPDCFLIILASLISSIIAEAMAYFFIYSSEGYKKLKFTIDRINRKLSKKKDLIPNIQNQKSHAKKLKTLQDELQSVGRSLSFYKLKSDVFIFSGFTLAFISTLNSLFEGKVVAKLPFEPFYWFHGLTHRGLRGNDFTDCSMIFLYVVCSIAFRANLQKVFGTTPPSTPSFFSTSQT
eukprot:TRINITY_DN6686_c0_g1_i1.p1 TRINITY_DN6686_c0_g1~~TRINITY_DN6686_c0_g1_i1.p1  ORF type:complete len:178 (-),score=12.59 TRINITY_DN6686_c0_g1_i1:13-546(-)